jgi:uncharacterized membrane protein
MSDPRRVPGWRRRTAHGGAFIVEFALLVVAFLTLIFGVIEIARYMYVINTLQEVTRRAASAAANVDFSNEAAKSVVRQNAIFRTASGGLVLADPVSDSSIRIDYLAIVKSNGVSTPTPIPGNALPSSPARNRFICKGHPNDAGCVRLVRVRVCDAGVAGRCEPVRFQTILPFVALPIDLPVSSTIVSAETLGFTAGMTAYN